MNYRERYEQWLNDKFFDEATRRELNSLTDEREIEDRFYRDLEFGTGGLRGVMGAGTNRMNKYTVGKATAGLGKYLLDTYGAEACKKRGVVIGYDTRDKVTKNNGNRCSAYVPEHHEAIVSPEIARAAHLVASSSKKCGVQDIVVIRQGALKGFVGIHPNWSGINAESIRSLCLSAYLPEEVVEANNMAEMRSGKNPDTALSSDYLTVSGTCFINQSSPVMTISKNGIRFSKACHTRLDDCEEVELLYNPILQVVILRKSSLQPFMLNRVHGAGCPGMVLVR